ncbi:flippase-like domain-containing protein [bacterium]|nr:flippase-like domain-containing protein [bacterium]
MLNLHQLWRKLLWSLVFCALVFIGLSLYANFEELSRALLTFPLYYLPVLLLLSLCNYLFRFFKWEYYLHILNIEIRRAQSISIFLAGLIMSISPGKFGEVLKSFLLKSINETPISRSAPIVVAERLTDFMGLIVLILLGLTSKHASIEVLLISLALVVVLVTVFSSRTISLFLIGLLEKMIRAIFTGDTIQPGSSTEPGNSETRHHFGVNLLNLPQKLTVAYESIHELVTPKRLTWTTILSVVSWSFEGIAFLILLHGFGFDFQMAEGVFIYAFSIILGALTMLPGGVGLTETSLSGLLILKEVPKPIAVAVTLIIRVTTLWFAVAIGAVMLLVFMRMNPRNRD